jgi:hypothetical protein
MTTDSTTDRSRRAVLAAAAAGAAGLAAGQLARPMAVAAHDPDDLGLNIDNPTTAATSVTLAAPLVPPTAPTAAFSGSTAIPDLGIGVAGKSTFAVTGGTYTPNVGVYGVSGADPAAVPSTVPTQYETGIYGYCDYSAKSAGVWGNSPQGAGTGGSGDYGVVGFGDSAGVYGEGSAGVHGVGTVFGVYASAEAPAHALGVNGKVLFRNGGVAIVLKKRSSVKVNLAGVTSDSYVLATLQTNRPGIYVQAVVCKSGSFTIYLNKAVPATTRVAFFVIN